MIEFQTFVAIAPNYYGKGRTIDEAVASAKKAGWNKPHKKTEIVMVGTDAEYDEVSIRADVSVHVNVPEDRTLVKFRADV